MTHEVWNSVDVYGPEAEISKFVRLCIVPDPDSLSDKNGLAVDFSKVPALASKMSTPNSGMVVPWHNTEAWNCRVWRREGSGCLKIGFDTDIEFPAAVFMLLAEIFPKLAFDCDCIEEADNFMGFGWFNTPPGAEDFSQDYDVPKNYWNRRGTGYKRDPLAQARHEALVAALKFAACDAAGEA